MVDTSRFFGNDGWDPVKEYEKSKNTVAPEGRYRFIITSIEPVVENRNGKGGHAEISFELEGGPQKGVYSLFQNFNLFHDETRVALIAERQFSQLCKSVKCRHKFNDPEDFLVLLSMKGMCDIRIKPGKGDFPPRNEVKEYIVDERDQAEAQRQDGAVHEAPTTDEATNLPHDPYANVPPADDDEDVPF